MDMGARAISPKSTKWLLGGLPDDAALRLGPAATTAMDRTRQRAWTTATKKAARPNPKRGCWKDNLVPKPVPELWQDTPEAPFEELQSEGAKGHLACCNLRSSMQKGQDERGRAAYACSAGETSF